MGVFLLHLYPTHATQIMISSVLSTLMVMLADSTDAATSAPFFGFMGVTSALVFACMGAAYGTAKSGVGVSAMGVMHPDLVMKSMIPLLWLVSSVSTVLLLLSSSVLPSIPPTTPASLVSLTWVLVLVSVSLVLPLVLLLVLLVTLVSVPPLNNLSFSSV